jgi:hypothetical protein
MPRLLSINVGDGQADLSGHGGVRESGLAR